MKEVIHQKEPPARTRKWGILSLNGQCFRKNANTFEKERENMVVEKIVVALDDSARKRRCFDKKGGLFAVDGRFKETATRLRKKGSLWRGRR